MTAIYQEQLEQSKLNGFWKFDGELIHVYDEAGIKMNVLYPTSSGLVAALYTGAPQKGTAYNAEFKLTDAEAKVSQSIKLYEDKNCIISTEYQGQPESQTESQTGTYELKDGVLVIDIGGGKSEVFVTKEGLALGMFEKIVK